MTTLRCEQETLVQIIYREYVLTIIYSIVLIAMMFAVYKYLMAHFRSATQQRSSKSLYYLSLVYYLLLIVDFIVIITSFCFWCRNESITRSAGVLATYLYATQGLLLLLILLHRLVSIFEDTVYAVPKTRARIFMALILADICLSNISYSMWRRTIDTHWSPTWSALYALSAFIGLCMFIGLNVAFIRRLVTAHKSCRNEASYQQELLTVITKTALLCFLSTWMSFLCMAAYFLRSIIHSVHYVFVYDLILLADLSTNFLSVLLIGKEFTAWYFGLCNWCHQRLILCCTMCVKPSDVKVDIVKKEVVLPTSPRSMASIYSVST